MCKTNQKCSCDKRNGVGHWWWPRAVPAVGVGVVVPFDMAKDIAHAYDNCTCDGRCLDTAMYRGIITTPNNAPYDPRFFPAPPQPMDYQPSYLSSISTATKLPPMKCCRCDFVNEYVGPEHLDDKGVYKCRACKQNPYR